MLLKPPVLAYIATYFTYFLFFNFPLYRNRNLCFEPILIT